jgi:folate-binding protein YgfZ
MDKIEAKQLINEELEILRAKSYKDLLDSIDTSLHYEKKGASGTLYQIELQVFWDDRPDGDLRVIGSVDDGGWRAFFPLGEDFIKFTEGFKQRIMTNDYEAITQSSALLTLPQWAPIFVDGPDAIDYLHRRLSQSISTLAPGQGTHALQLNATGGMQADLLLWHSGAGCYILTDCASVESVAEMIERTVIMDQVTVHKTWEREGVVGLMGPEAPGLLASLIDGAVDTEPLQQPGWAAVAASVGGHPCRIGRDGRWGLPMFHLVMPLSELEAVVRMLEDASSSQEGRTVGERAYHLARIENGVTLHGIDTTEETIPLEAGLEGAICYDKGCYPGQEVIARITNLGHPARVMVRLSIDRECALESGAELIFQGHRAGVVTSSESWPGLGRTEALGRLQWSDRQATEVQIQTSEGPVTVTVTPLKG